LLQIISAVLMDLSGIHFPAIRHVNQLALPGFVDPEGFALFVDVGQH
jgi:hypothetical protein